MRVDKTIFGTPKAMAAIPALDVDLVEPEMDHARLPVSYRGRELRNIREARGQNRQGFGQHLLQRIGLMVGDGVNGNAFAFQPRQKEPVLSLVEPHAAQSDIRAASIGNSRQRHGRLTLGPAWVAASQS